MLHAIGAVFAALLMSLPLAGEAAANARRLVATDVIQVRVVNQSDLDTQARIGTDGNIDLPYVGRLRAAGLTESELAARIRAALERGDVVKSPQVLVSIVSFGSQVSVQGAVVAPSIIPLDRPMTLTEALSRAGGLKPNASIVVVRRGGTVTRYNAKDLLRGKTNEHNPYVQNLDEIYVDEPSVYFLYGHVRQPGQYPLTRALTVQQALAAGGGVTEMGSDRLVQVKRRLPDGQITVLWVSLDDEVQGEDTIVVNERLF